MKLYISGNLVSEWERILYIQLLKIFCLHKRPIFFVFLRHLFFFFVKLIQVSYHGRTCLIRRDFRITPLLISEESLVENEDGMYEQMMEKPRERENAMPKAMELSNKIELKDMLKQAVPVYKLSWK